MLEKKKKEFKLQVNISNDNRLWLKELKSDTGHAISDIVNYILDKARESQTEEQKEAQKSESSKRRKR